MAPSTDDLIDEELEITAEELSGPRIDRRTALKLLGATGITGLAGCTGGDGDGGDDGGGDQSPTSGDQDTDETETQADDSSNKYGGELKAAWLASEFSTLDPTFSTLSQVQWMIENIFSGILEFAPDFSIQGDIAEDWEVSDDGLQITFQLVDNAMFHNGDQVSAEDIEYSITRIFNTDSPHQSNLNALQAPSEGGVEVLGDYEVRLNLSSVFAPLLANLTVFNWSGAVVSQGAIDSMGKEEYNLNPVGSGPFQITEHELGNVLRVERFEDYHKSLNGDQLPYLDAIEFFPLNDPSTRINALKSGEANFVEFFPKTRTDEVQGDEYVVDTTPTNAYGGIGINTREGVLSDVKVRQAIAKSVNKEEFVEKALGGFGAPGGELFSPSLGWVYREEFGDDGVGGPQKDPSQVYDPDGAQALAEEAGATDVTLELVTPPPTERWAQVVKPMIENTLGWTVEVKFLDYSALFPRVSAGDFQMLMWGGGGPEPDFFYEDFGPVEAQEGQGNWYGFMTDELSELSNKSRTVLPRTGNERRDILWQIEDIVIQNVPFVFCSHRSQVVVYTSNLKGFKLMDDNRRFRNVYFEE